MKPMEAWQIISRNMAELYRRRITDGDPHGYSEDDTMAEVVAFMALKKMEELGWLPKEDTNENSR